MMRIWLVLAIISFTTPFCAQNNVADVKKFLNDGIIAYNQGNHLAAIKHYSKGIEMRQKFNDAYILAELYINRALCRMELGSKQALEDANAAVAIKPEYAQSYYIRGLIYLSLKQPEQAIINADSAIWLKPLEPKFFFLKLASYRMKKMPAEELLTVNSVLTFDPKNMTALQERGSVYMEMHAFDSAIVDLHRVLSYQPGNFGALCNMASCYSELKHFDEAKQYFLKALAADTSQSYLIYNNIGYFVNVQEKNYPEAIRNFNKAIAQNPKFGYSYNNRAYAKLMMGETKEALKDVNRAIELNPQNSYAYKNRALIFIAEKRNASACLDLKKALELGYAQQYDNEVDELMKTHCQR